MLHLLEKLQAVLMHGYRPRDLHDRAGNFWTKPYEPLFPITARKGAAFSAIKMLWRLKL
jgi:hypothetical protein